MIQEDEDYLRKTLIVEKIDYQNMIENKCSSNDQFFKLNSIISIKILLKYSKEDSIYLDFKAFFKLYIAAVDENEFDYDNISVGKIISKLNDIDIEHRINLIKYFKRLLGQSGYTEESKLCDNFIKLNVFAYLKKNPKNWLDRVKLLYIWTSLSVYNLIMFIFLFYFLTLIFLLPAPNDSMKFFNFRQYHYCNSDIANYSMNTLALLFGIETTKVESENITGLILVIMGKVIYITVLLNYLLKHLYKQFNLTE